VRFGYVTEEGRARWRALAKYGAAAAPGNKVPTKCPGCDSLGMAAAFVRQVQGALYYSHGIEFICSNYHVWGADKIGGGVARVLSSHYPFYDLLLTTGACLSTAQAVLHDVL
jgi:hypothetical protein